MHLQTTIMKNPAGTYSVVGSVPETCLRLSDPPTRSQVLGGRWFKRDGRTIGWDDRAFPTIEEAEGALKAAGVTDYAVFGS